MNLLFTVVDVFTNQPFAGNPLAIVYHEAEESLTLATGQMQALAREMNLSETVFVTNWDWGSRRFTLRIFTPSTELPFAGHPSIGAAAWLAGRDTMRESTSQSIDLVERAGLVRCTAQWTDDAGHATLIPPQLPEQSGTEAGGKVAAELGVPVSALVGDVEVWSAGMAVHCVELDQPGRLAELQAPALGGPLGSWELCCFASGPGEDEITARVFPLAAGIQEDPATGAAAVALAGRIAPKMLRDRGQAHVAIQQGAAMGRASTLRLHLLGAAGRLEAVQLSGEVVAVSEGRWLRVPSGD
ncbi:PhzF family phenazine biosynthesis protein [Abyssibacter sp.]|uniref:PhzF family phenazine biosynthesis protein n=1 Tax=Abyssibacter sp. TaxID=2320200 RepID=UPI003514E421